MTDIPEPELTGSAGTQRSATVDIVPTANTGTFDALPLTRAVEGLAATRSRGMGGEVVAGLLAGSFGQISHELAETKAELRATRTQLDAAKEALANSRIENATLKQHVKSCQNNRQIHNIAIFTGTIILGLSVELHRNHYESAAFAVGLMGILLVLVGWLTPKKEVLS